MASAFCVIALSLTACAPAYRLAPIQGSIETADYPLPSGLRIIFHQDRARPTVTLVALVGAGGSHDPDGRDGIAHLIEHLTFRATHDGRLVVHEIIEGIGGTYNAYTSGEETVYFTTAPVSALPGLLRLEALRMTDPLAGITQATFDTEREVVRNEMRQRLENGVTRPLFDQLETMLFAPGHDRRKSIIGDHASLSAITLDDARAFVRQHYTPGNITLVISGDIDLAATPEWIARSFPPALITADGHPPPPGQPLTLTPRPPRLTPGATALPTPPVETLRRIRGDVTRPTLLVGWALPGQFSGHGTVMQMVARSTSSAMHRRMRPRTEDIISQVDGIGCSLALGARDSVMTCMIEAAPGIELDDLIDDARAALEFDERAHRRMLTRATLAEVSDGSLAHRIALQAHYTGRIDAFHKRLGEIQTAKWGTDFTYGWYDIDRRAVLLIEPLAEAPPAPTVAFDKTATWDGTVFQRSPHTAAIHAGLQPAAIAAIARPPLPPTVERFQLPQGLTVITVPDPTAQIVYIGLYTRGGSLTTRPMGMTDFVGLASLARDPSPFLGRWFDMRWGDAQFIGIEAPRGNLAPALHAFAAHLDTIFVPFTTIGFEKYLDFEIARLDRDRRLRGARALEAMTHKLYRDHPLGATRYDRAGLLALSLDDFEHHFERAISPANGTLIVAGGYDPATLRAQLIEHLGGWRSDDPGALDATLPPPPPPPEQRHIAFESDPDATQTSLQVACLLDGDPTLDMARSVLAEVVRIDLWRSLRETTGSAYSPGAWVALDAGGNARLRIDAEVQNDQALAALRVVLDRLGALAAGELPTPDLREAQWKVARRTQLANRTVYELTATLIDALRTGATLEALAATPDRLATVDAAALARVLAPCAGHEIVAAVGPDALIAPLADIATTSRVPDIAPAGGQ